MGIRDRDYMKRRSDEDQRSLSGSKIEELLTGFFRRHPRFFLYAGIGLGALILITLLIPKISGGAR
jgi:hypothetical protein